MCSIFNSLSVWVLCPTIDECNTVCALDNRLTASLIYLEHLDKVTFSGLVSWEKYSQACLPLAPRERFLIYCTVIFRGSFCWLFIEKPSFVNYIYDVSRLSKVQDKLFSIVWSSGVLELIVILLIVLWHWIILISL
jgi:hypothetical protein